MFITSTGRAERANIAGALTRVTGNKLLKAAFWHERWERDQLGFHQEDVNSLLIEHWPTLSQKSASEVFVPLCGKSHDMRWLRDAGHEVVGVELSPIACRDFFVEAGIEAIQSGTQSGTRSGTQPLDRFEGEGYRLLCGDFFDLEPADLIDVRGVFDRASLIALPPEMRRRYAHHMTAILPEDVTILLITLDYDQSKMNGPPHSVPNTEVEALFGEAFSLDILATTGFVEPHIRFRERGLDSWCETVWRLGRGTTQ
jgi:thiopurine S-methyltransferase